jgi:hypothetical protein
MGKVDRGETRSHEVVWERKQGRKRETVDEGFGAG